MTSYTFSVNDDTKRQADMLLGTIGLDIADLFPLFIKWVKNNEAQIDALTADISAARSKSSRAGIIDCMKGKVKISDDFDEPMNGVMPVAGLAKGKMWIADDFDEPLEDFAEYM